jgi:hypothetical protein
MVYDLKQQQDTPLKILTQKKNFRGFYYLLWFPNAHKNNSIKPDYRCNNKTWNPTYAHKKNNNKMKNLIANACNKNINKT